MQKMIAICGLVCTECPAYLATQKDDNEERKKIAERWASKEFPLKPEDVNCDGCLRRTSDTLKPVRRHGIHRS